MRKCNRSQAKGFTNHSTIVFCFDMLLFMKDILLTLVSLFEYIIKNMVWWTNAWTGPTTVTVTLHVTILQPRSSVTVMRTTTELENRDNVTVSIFIITTSLMCHCNVNYSGTGELGQCHCEYLYHYNLLNVSL